MRTSANDRGYTKKWLRARIAFQKNNIWCLGCWAIGVQRRTEVVDHIIPHQGDPELFWAIRNWQPCCSWHHNSIKPQMERDWKAKKIQDKDLRLDSEYARRLTRSKYRPAIGVDGFAIQGT